MEAPSNGQDIDVVLLDVNVTGHQCQTFELGLGYQDAVEGVAVVHRQPSRCCSVLGGDVQGPEAAITYVLGQVGRVEFAKRLVDGDFPYRR